VFVGFIESVLNSFSTGQVLNCAILGLADCDYAVAIALLLSCFSNVLLDSFALVFLDIYVFITLVFAKIDALWGGERNEVKWLLVVEFDYTM
jgi:hypothetical protein